MTIAGSDSGGGAGIQADIKAISATGSYAASAITAVTVQNTLGVEAVHPVPTDIISAQISCVLSDIGADAIKIGMLHSAEVVLAVRDALLQALCPEHPFQPADIVAEEAAEKGVKGISPVFCPESPSLQPAAATFSIVLDPVMVATSGHRLIEESAIKVLRDELMPLARVITPNIPEAEILVGYQITRQQDLPSVARELSSKVSRTSPVSVLMKAGHLTDDRLVDVFYNAEDDHIVELPSARLYTPNTHGTGCTLSSAFASFLAQGMTLDDAARVATGYIHEAIAAGADYQIGRGHGPVDHFYKLHK